MGNDYSRVPTVDAHVVVVPETLAVLEDYRQTGNKVQFCHDVITDSRRRQCVLCECMLRLDPSDVKYKKIAVGALKTSVETEEKATRWLRYLR